MCIRDRRYNEASLVKTLEEKGIGRPSTYSPIIETILGRGYVVRVDKKFEPTELGFVVVDMLKEYFETIVEDVYKRQAYNRSPSVFATARLVPTQSLLKSTRATRRIEGSM